MGFFDDIISGISDAAVSVNNAVFKPVINSVVTPVYNAAIKPVLQVGGQVLGQAVNLGKQVVTTAFGAGKQVINDQYDTLRRLEGAGVGAVEGISNLVQSPIFLIGGGLLVVVLISMVNKR